MTKINFKESPSSKDLSYFFPPGKEMTSTCQRKLMKLKMRNVPRTTQILTKLVLRDQIFKLEITLPLRVRKLMKLKMRNVPKRTQILTTLVLQDQTFKLEITLQLRVSKQFFSC